MLGLGYGIASPALWAARWSPSMNFGAAGQGVLLRPNRFDTLFQDAAGTIPVNAPGQPVGLIRDLSGRGNHASQSVALSRPILARHPASGLRQLLSNSTDLTTWGGPASVALHETLASGELVYEISDNDSAVNHSRSLSVNLTSGQSYCFSARVWAGSAEKTQISCQTFGSSAGVIVTWSGGTPSSVVTNGPQTGAVSCDPDPVNAGYYIMRGVLNAAVSGSHLMYLWPSAFEAGGLTTGTSYFGSPQIEVGTVRTGYQAASAAYDVSEAGYSSIWGLKFDGIDDYLTTPTINWGTDEIEVIYAARKPADAAAGVLAEYGASTQDGSWSVVYPGAPGETWGRYGRAFSRGTSNVGAGISNALTQYAGPQAIVGGYRAKISTDTLIPRVNGVDLPGAAADQGGGNYANRALTIGRAAGGSSPFAGTIYSLEVINRMLTPTERSRAERYFAAASGVTIP